MMNPLKPAAILMVNIFLICFSGSLVSAASQYTTATITYEPTSLISNPKVTCTGINPTGRQSMGPNNEPLTREDPSLSISWTPSMKMSIIYCQITDTAQNRNTTIRVYTSRGNERHLNIRLRAGEGIFDGKKKISSLW